MSVSHQDVEILIARVDDICKFLNNMKKTNKTTTERINALEANQKRKDLETNTNDEEPSTREKRICDLEDKITKLDDMIKKEHESTKRLDNIEIVTVKNQEEIKKFMTRDSEKNFVTKNKELQFEHQSLKKGIHDLDKQISILDEQYNNIKNNIEIRVSKSEEMDHKVFKIESDMESIKKKFQTSPSESICDSLKCMICGELFVSKNNLRQHISANHPKSIECQKCDERFATNSQLQRRIKEHSSVKLFKCEECDKSFNFQWRLNKHKEMHGRDQMIRKCHFFNNAKQCPFEEIGCKFLHQESIQCKYSTQCKFDRCQF